MPTWLTHRPNRTIAQLHAAAADIAREAQRKATANAARQPAKRLAAMAVDPTGTLRESERLVADRTANAYRRLGELLADLREALSATDRSALAEKQAQKLKAANPRLHLLTSELRRQGFVPK